MSFNKFTKWLLILLGCGILVAFIGIGLGGSTSVYYLPGDSVLQPHVARREYWNSAMDEPYHSINIDINDVIFYLDNSTEGLTYLSVETYDAALVPEMRVENGVLRITQNESPGRALQIGVNVIADTHIVLSIPKDIQLERLDWKQSGHIRMNHITAKTIKLLSRVGLADVDDTTCDSLDISTSLGYVELERVNVNQSLRINSNDDVYLRGTFLGDTHIESYGEVAFNTTEPRAAYDASLFAESGRIRHFDYEKGDRPLKPEANVPSAPNILNVRTRWGDITCAYNANEKYFQGVWDPQWENGWSEYEDEYMDEYDDQSYMMGDGDDWESGEQFPQTAPLPEIAPTPDVIANPPAAGISSF